MLTIRACATAADYAAVAEIQASFMPDPDSGDEIRANDEKRTAAGYPLRRMVATDESGAVVGFSLALHHSAMREHEWRTFTGVRPEARGNGLGTLLLAEVEQWVRAQGARLARSQVRGEAAIDWAVRHGYSLTRRRTESVLDLTAWDGRRFAADLEAVRASGIRLVTTADMPEEPILRQLFEVDNKTTPDIPGFDWVLPDWESWLKRYKSQDFNRFFAMAFDGDRLVGYSEIKLPNQAGRDVYTMYTTTLREYRGRGLALATKVLTINYARAMGFTQMRTNNDPDNPSMLAVNRKLGYRMVEGPSEVAKTLYAIRPVSAEDYEALATLVSMERQEEISAADLAAGDARRAAEPGAVFRRLVAFDAGGAMQGFGTIHCTPAAPGAPWWLGGFVAPERRGQGLGSQLADELELRARELGATVCRSSCKGTDAETYAWLERRGYTLERSRLEGVLDLSAFQPSAFAADLDRVRQAGITLRVVSSPISDELLHQLYPVAAETYPEIPCTDLTELTWEEFLEELSGGPGGLLVALAEEGGKVVGYTDVGLPKPGGRRAHTGFTGTLRSHRGMGLALALKVLAAEAVRARGVSFMTTRNDPENAPMLAVNRKLGYAVNPGPRWLRKTLR